jgi:hypothetical protein
MNTPDTSNSPEIPLLDLTEALAAFHAEDTLTSRAAVIVSLTISSVTVLLDSPWDGKSLPQPDTRFMLVSDGDNVEQPMLALFSDKTKAEGFRQNIDIGNQFEHIVEVSGSWSLLGVEEGMGIMIDPNQSTAFRIAPELAAQLRNDVAATMERITAKHDQGITSGTGDA